jgi:hypothetical protein
MAAKTTLVKKRSPSATSLLLFRLECFLNGDLGETEVVEVLHEMEKTVPLKDVQLMTTVKSVISHALEAAER